MQMLILFLALFAVVTLLLLAATSARAEQRKQTLSRLDAIALAPGMQTDEDDPLSVRRAETLSSLPWLDRLLAKADFAPRLRMMLYQADLKWTVGRLVLSSAVSAALVGVLVYLRTRGILAALLLAALTGYMPFLYAFYRRNQRFDRIRQLLPEALDLMVAAIRAGHGFTSAIGMAAKESPEPLRREFRKCYDEQNFGVDLRTAMLNLALAVPIHDVRIIVTAVLIQKETGGNLTEILEKAAHLIREDFRLQRQIRVHTAQGRLTGWILSILPVALGFGLYLANPEHMSLLWRRPVGLKMMYASIAMTLIGGLIIRKIIRFRI
jgi:tight adherence protein B